ncbi:hypothetical protein FM107_12570 [Sphingobacterium sp. JB170]|nr:hypothetical protein FM107_12570 [Sphingobacterium sp. JB170]
MIAARNSSFEKDVTMNILNNDQPKNVCIRRKRHMAAADLEKIS